MRHRCATAPRLRGVSFSLPKFAALTLAIVALGAVGCGSQPTSTTIDPASLALNSAPGAIDSGALLARQKGWDRAAGVDLKILPGVSSGQALRRLTSGASQFALIDIADLVASDRRQPGKLVALVAIVQRSLPALSKQRPARERRLAGRLPGPAFPELLLVTTRQMTIHQPYTVDAVTVAIQRGYNGVIDNPESGVQAVVAANPNLNEAIVRRQVTALLPAFKLPDERFGTLDGLRLRAWAEWEVKSGLADQLPNLDRLFSGPLFVPIPYRLRNH